MTSLALSVGSHGHLPMLRIHRTTDAVYLFGRVFGMKNVCRLLSLIVLSLVVSGSSVIAGELTLNLKGKDGPGKGKHVVLIAGDEEYRTEESMPMLGKILSQKHGFDCTVIFSWDESNRYIDPNNQKGLRGLEALKRADLMIIGTRFRRPGPEEAKHVSDFLNAGKPVIGIRTATHAFNGEGSFGGDISYGKFGRLVLGEQWVSHHGGHKRQGCRGIIEDANKKHAILNSVADVFAPSDVYGVTHLTDDDQILMRGAVTKTLDPKSQPIPGKKNDPMMPLAWLHSYKAPNGTKGTSFCTTAGASVDLLSEDLRRMLVNATYHLLKMDVPKKADVDFVDPFYPSFYGFINDKSFWPGLDMQVEDYGLGKSPIAPDPKGTPNWPSRPKRPEPVGAR